MTLVAIDHIQLAMPRGGEDAARAFYGDLLRLAEEAKPAELAARGGCWFRNAGLRVHLGVDPDFRPARKAHPAFRVEEFAKLVARLRAAGVAVTDDSPFEGAERAYVDDPFGNRIELIDASS